MGGKENLDLERKLTNQNNSFPLCPIRFYLSIEARNRFSFQKKGPQCKPGEIPDLDPGLTYFCIVLYQW